MFKKYLSILLITLLSSSSMADTETGGYIKGSIGYNKIFTTKIEDQTYIGHIKVSETFPVVEIGAGYQFPDGIRTELVYDYYFRFASQDKSIDKHRNIFDIVTTTRAQAIFFNAYKDIITIKSFTPFVGVGLGMSTIEENAKGYVVSNISKKQYELTSTTSHKVNRFAYKLTAGLEVALNPNVIAEFSYNYFNLGKNKPKIIDGLNNVQHRNYTVHNILLGFRLKL